MPNIAESGAKRPRPVYSGEILWLFIFIATGQIADFTEMCNILTIWRVSYE